MSLIQGKQAVRTHQGVYTGQQQSHAWSGLRLKQSTLRMGCTTSLPAKQRNESSQPSSHLKPSYWTAAQQQVTTTCSLSECQKPHMRSTQCIELQSRDAARKILSEGQLYRGRKGSSIDIRVHHGQHPDTQLWPQGTHRQLLALLLGGHNISGKEAHPPPSFAAVLWRVWNISACPGLLGGAEQERLRVDFAHRDWIKRHLQHVTQNHLSRGDTNGNIKGHSL